MERRSYTEAKAQGFTTPVCDCSHPLWVRNSDTSPNVRAVFCTTCGDYWVD